MALKSKIPPVLWIVFIVVDLAIVGAVLAAVFWVAPVPVAFQGDLSLAQAKAVKPNGLTVAVVTADSCLACQMYKRGALADADVTTWIESNAGATYLKWGKDEAEIQALGVDRYPATVVLAGDAVLATHYGGMNAQELLAFLDRAAGSAAPPVVELEAVPEPESGAQTPTPASDSPPTP